MIRRPARSTPLYSSAASDVYKRQLGVDVVALLVVGRGHAVQRGIEIVSGDVDALVGLLERQRDPATLEVDVDDLDHDPVSYTHLRAHETKANLVCRLLLE